MKNYTNEQLVKMAERYEKSRMTSEKYRVKQLLLAKKAIENGLEVSDEEILEYMNKK